MQPNVLLIVLDAVRKDHLSCYGHSRPTTPHVDRLAADGTRYEHAISAASWTHPSHASMFTGRYASHHGAVGVRPQLRDDQPHVAEELRNGGYATMGFSNSSWTSADRGFDRGFDYYDDWQKLPRIDLPGMKDVWYEFTTEYVKTVLAHLAYGYETSYFQAEKMKRQLRSVNQPFFSFINFNSAHSPYDPPRQFGRLFEGSTAYRSSIDVEKAKRISADAYEFIAGKTEVHENEWGLIKRWYDGEIAYLDALVGGVVELLKRQNQYENTLIVVTSDHGELFGEDGLAYHHFSLAEELINVPLVVKWPQNHEATVSEELVSLTDFAPTVLDAADISRPTAMQGRSLLSDEEPDAVFSEHGYPRSALLGRITKHDGDPDPYNRSLQAIRTKEHKLVADSRGDATLYEIVERSEPNERPERPIEDEQRARELRRELNATLETLPPAEDETEEDLDEHVEKHLKEMGYL